MNRLAVYTVQTGSKGDFEGFGIDPHTDVDLILFTDDPKLRIGGVDTRVIDTHGLDPARSSRLPKLLPHRYLPEYEWSLYVDANCRLKQNPATLLRLCTPEPFDFFSFAHPHRSCIYEEAEVVIGHDYDKEERVREQIDHYRRTGYPANEGLITATVLLRRHHNKETVQISEEWYEHVLRFSKRDQLSFNFVAWRNRYRHGVLPGSVRENDYVMWPARPRNQRITADFDPEIYAWLNPEYQESGLSAQEHFLERRRSGNKVGRYKRHSWKLRKIANKQRSDKGNIYYNAHAYADIYELMLQHRTVEPLRVLELGLSPCELQAETAGAYTVPSLAMWREFLPNASIWGFDTEDFSRLPLLPGVTVIRGDIECEHDVARLIETTGGGFDVIIDSGCHGARHQQSALGFLFAHLNAGGLYFIENLHRQPDQVDGEEIPTTRHVLQSLSCGTLVSTPQISEATLEQIIRSGTSIRFFDSADRSFGTVHADALAVLSPAAPTPDKKDDKVNTAQGNRSLIKKFGSYAVESGWTRSEAERGPVDKDGNPLPWYTYPAIRFLEERVKEDMNVFEFGSGNSTLWWAARVKRVTSVEHDPDWSDLVRNRMPPSVSYHTTELEPGGRYSQFSTLCGNGPFDVIVIDGRDRVNCAIDGMKNLKEDGVIIFDNADRRRYRHAHGVLMNNEFRRIKFIGIGALSVKEWDTSIFYRSKNCLRI